jgi:hypothetical protein
MNDVSTLEDAGLEKPSRKFPKTPALCLCTRDLCDDEKKRFQNRHNKQVLYF